MKVRPPARTIVRIYVRPVTTVTGQVKYEARVRIPGTNINFSCIRDRLKTAVRCARQKVGIRT
jgi:hypothetical protein